MLKQSKTGSIFVGFVLVVVAESQRLFFMPCYIFWCISAVYTAEYPHLALPVLRGYHSAVYNNYTQHQYILHYYSLFLCVWSTSYCPSSASYSVSVHTLSVRYILCSTSYSAVCEEIHHHIYTTQSMYSMI